ncbi:MAG: hypothetical protein IPN60_09465 [Saprospiraceae bacterium]|nr:hypothetical protein [Candidatus Opimibacter skivensis]
MELLLKLTGFVLIALGLFHVFFPKYFKWKEEFSRVSMINRQMMYVHSFFIAFVVVLIGLLCVTSATDLLKTPLGKRISLGISIFWITRLFIQFFGYSTSLWKGKTFETGIHILFSILWIGLSAVFILAYLA